MSRLRFIFAGLLLTVFLPATASAVGEIKIDNPTLKQQSPDRYEMTAVIYNKSAQPREVTLRGQVFFFEEFAPKGDKPAMVLRKDETVVLKRGEARRVKFILLNEGTLPKARLRLEPEVRVRRHRVWHY